MELVFVDEVPPVGSGFEPGPDPLPVLDMTDGGFLWQPEELAEAVRLMRDRLFESDDMLDEDLPKRAHLKKRRAA